MTPRVLSTGNAPSSPLPKPKAPSTNESLEPRSLLALGAKLESRHWCLGLAASAQLPTRFYAQVLCARPNHRAGYSPEISGHVLSVDFYNRSDPRAQPRTLQTPATCGAVKRIPPRGWVALLLRDSANWTFTVRGSRHRFPGLATPTSASVRPWIYPKLFDPDTSCRASTSSALWINMCEERPVG